MLLKAARADNFLVAICAANVMVKTNQILGAIAFLSAFFIAFPVSGLRPSR